MHRPLNLKWQGPLPPEADLPEMILGIAEHAARAADLRRPQTIMSLHFGDGVENKYTPAGFRASRESDEEKFGRAKAATVEVADTDPLDVEIHAQLTLTLHGATLHIHAAGTTPTTARRAFRAAIVEAERIWQREHRDRVAQLRPTGFSPHPNSSSPSQSSATEAGEPTANSDPTGAPSVRASREGLSVDRGPGAVKRTGLGWSATSGG